MIDSSGNLIAVDIVSGGFGYKIPPQVQVIDPCKNGSGAVLQTIIGDQILSGEISGNQFGNIGTGNLGSGNIGSGNLGTGNIGTGNIGAGLLFM